MMNRYILKNLFRLLNHDNLKSKLNMIKNENSKVLCNENKIISQPILAYFFNWRNMRIKHPLNLKSL